jgi:hypothetical protein
MANALSYHTGMLVIAIKFLLHLSFVLNHKKPHSSSFILTHQGPIL